MSLKDANCAAFLISVLSLCGCAEIQSTWDQGIVTKIGTNGYYVVDYAYKYKKLNGQPFSPQEELVKSDQQLQKGQEVIVFFDPILNRKEIVSILEK